MAAGFMSELTVGQTSHTYTYYQLIALRRWVESDPSLAHAVYGFIAANDIEQSHWLFWFEFAVKIQADRNYPEKAFPHALHNEPA